jgi:3-deoxy-D-arabino-heptulosonate 7-phosphate (DAHP) synthase
MSQPELKVIIYGDDAVGIITEGGMSLFTPQVAVEIAQSLINVAKEVDPLLNVEAVMKAYHETHGYHGDN